jgi:hypothetical protein
MKAKKEYKNDISIAQLQLACKQYKQMRKAGVTENYAIRQLEFFSDVYSKIATHKSRAVHHVSRVKLWSRKAIRWRNKNPDAKARENLRVEHGTPKRAFARIVLGLHDAKKLTEKEMAKVVKQYWKLAVITIDEDLRLNKYARSRKYSSPRKRWRAAGIKLQTRRRKK